MPTTEAINVDAGGRELRVSNPERVIFPATERSAAVTKLDIVEYYLAVGDGIMRALERRPTTLERWTKGVYPGMVLSTREGRVGDAFYQKRIPKGAPDYVQTAQIAFPSGRHADEVCPTEIAVVGWAAQMGTITFHPWPVRRDDVDHPDELRLDLDPQPGTDFADAVRAAGEARALLGRARLHRLPEDLGRPGHPHLRPDRAAVDVHRRPPRRDRVRARARAAPARPGDDQLVEGGARRADLRRLQPERPRPHDRLGVQHPAEAGRAGVRAARAGTSCPTVAPEDFTVATMPARFAEVGDRHAAINDVAHSLQPLLDLYEADAARGQGDMPYPPDYPKMPGEPKRVQPSRDRDRPR